MSTTSAVKSFKAKLIDLIKDINDSLDYWTTHAMDASRKGILAINNQKKPIPGPNGKTPLKPYLSSSATGYFTGVPDRISSILKENDISHVRYGLQPGDAYPLYTTLNLLIFGIAYKRNINLVTDQLDFILNEVIQKTLFSKNASKAYSTANIYADNNAYTIIRDNVKTLKSLSDTELLFYLMNKIDVSMWRGKSVWFAPAKQWGVIGSNLVKSNDLPDYNKDPLGYVIILHGFLIDRWLNKEDVMIAKQALLYAINNPGITNDDFYKYVQKDMNARFANHVEFWEKNQYTKNNKYFTAPPATPVAAPPAGGSKKPSTKKLSTKKLSTKKH